MATLDEQDASGVYSNDLNAVTLGGVNPYTSAVIANEMAQKRRQRNYYVWQILTRTWSEYLTKPDKMPARVWNSLTRRFTMTDLVTPVLRAITSATYGGKVTRKLSKCINLKQVQDFMAAAGYEDFVRRQFFPGSIAYGTDYAMVGYNGERPSLALLPQLCTSIMTPRDDVTDVLGLEVAYEDFVKQYTDHGIFIVKNNSREMRPATDFGFIPVAIGRAAQTDSTTPYAESLVWPAAAEGKQITYLSNDIMVLARMQSFSTLVVKGTIQKDPKDKDGWGPAYTLRFDTTNDPNAGAEYITPQAAIEKLNDIIDKKFERAAVQCNVPIEIFTKSKAGTQMAAGAALLQHKPLYDLALELQEKWREIESDLIARISAMVEWSISGGEPQVLQRHRDALEYSMVFENESNPHMTLEDAQTMTALYDAGFLPFEDCYNWFKPDGTDEEMNALKAKREEKEKALTQPALPDMVPPSKPMRDAMNQPEETPS